MRLIQRDWLTQPAGGVPARRCGLVFRLSRRSCKDLSPPRRWLIHGCRCAAHLFDGPEEGIVTSRSAVAELLKRSRGPGTVKPVSLPAEPVLKQTPGRAVLSGPWPLRPVSGPDASRHCCQGDLIADVDDAGSPPA